MKNKSKTRYEKLMKERRIVAVMVDISVFGNMLLRMPDRITTSGLPEDAIFISADKDIYTKCFVFIYAHENFDKVPEGVCAPIGNISLTVHRKNAK